MLFWIFLINAWVLVVSSEAPPGAVAASSETAECEGRPPPPPCPPYCEGGGDN